VANNQESRRRQYGLADRARQLGWSDVAVIDDDLGRSGGGVARPGFEKLLAAICEGRVGAVVSIEASRLARNGRDWHTLLEFCGLVGTPSARPRRPVPRRTLRPQTCDDRGRLPKPPFSCGTSRLPPEPAVHRARDCRGKRAHNLPK
jgi:hypothetical protein